MFSRKLVVLALTGMALVAARSQRRGAATARAATAPAGGAPAAGAAAPAPAEEEDRLRLLRRDMETLRRDIATLSGTEQGLLGELKALEADVLRKQEALASAEKRVEEIEKEAASAEEKAAESSRTVEEMRGTVANRLRALYRLGPPRYFRVLLASTRPEELLSAYRAARSLATRDAELIGRFRDETVRQRQEASRLKELRSALVSEREVRRQAHEEAARALGRRRGLLASIRSDRQTHQTALGEMEAAARSFERAVSGIVSAAPPAERPRIGFDRLRGLLDWPADGRVSESFGKVRNPKFGTSLLHSGLDIDAAFGAPIRTIYDGSVVFSQWFRGYGLTVIVDHGGGWLTVYGHASALLVEKGEAVRRGQKIAVVGDSGSLRGPYLYFELRKDGRPVDPLGWLHSR